MIKVRYIVIDALSEFEWCINSGSIRKLEKCWNSCSDMLFDKIGTGLTDNLRIIIFTTGNNVLFLVYKNFIVKKTGNIIYVKKDIEKKFENIVLTTVPQNHKRELYSLVKSNIKDAVSKIEIKK